MAGAFDFINSINDGKPIRLDDDYSQYLVNMYFSMFPDTILIANGMNCAKVTDLQHYTYMLAKIRPRKRYKKWPKKRKNYDDDLNLIMHFYKYSRQKAKEILPIMGEEQIAAIKQEYFGVI